MLKVEYDQMPTAEAKEMRWKIKRSTRITASGLAKLNTPGRNKNDLFGEKAIDYIDDIVFQIRENDIVDDIDAKALDFGKDNEYYAFEWLKDNVMDEVKIGATDFGNEILFMRIGDYFGDTPDGLVFRDGEPVAWIEIKCPYNKKKAANMTRSTVTAADVVNEYRDQFIGHFIGNPNVDEGWYIIYNAHRKIDGTPYNRGRIFVLNRKDFEPSIQIMEAKIEKIYKFILLCVEEKFKPKDINIWWSSE